MARIIDSRNVPKYDAMSPISWRMAQFHFATAEAEHFSIGAENILVAVRTLTVIFL